MNAWLKSNWAWLLALAMLLIGAALWKSAERVAQENVTHAREISLMETESHRATNASTTTQQKLSDFLRSAPVGTTFVEQSGEKSLRFERTNANQLLALLRDGERQGVFRVRAFQAVQVSPGELSGSATLQP